ncbi:unnamed protein product [Urochloa humidicola]
MRLLPIALIGILFSLHTTSSSADTDTLSPGRVLVGNERLISSNGKFALGFFQTGKESNNTLNSYLGIRFNKVPKLTLVWTANGDNPSAGPASPELMISGDGNLIVMAQGTIVWTTKINFTSNNDTVAVLMDSGNLVLRSSSNSSDIFWQSFDYPTDTLLSGAKIGRNMVTGTNLRYVSRRNLIDQAPGVYSAELGVDGVIRLLWKSSVPYWSSGEWNGRFFNSIPEMSGQSGPKMCNFTFVNNKQEVSFSYTLLNGEMIYISAVDVSGQMQTRVWSDLAHDWITAGTGPKYQCGVYAACGPFTVCTDNAIPLCKCLKGFSIRSPEDWKLEDRTGGCIKNTPLNCGGHGNRNKSAMTDKFYFMTSISLPPNAKGIQNVSSAKECAQVCLGTCSCTAYAYGNSGCSVWHDELINIAADGNGESIYLRLAAKELQSWKYSKRGMIIGVTIGSSTAILGLIFLVVIRNRLRRKWSSLTVDNYQAGVGITAFRYIDLQRATKKFSEKLGEGSFGSVFMGFLSDSVIVAVKRLEGVRQGDKQFRAEVRSIGIIQHINLVKLIGFCCEGDKRLLVYEHMPNGSLDSHLFQSHGAILNWATRYQIALGVAKGIGYLHHGCRDCIIHCDIKPQNILLDTSFIPKIADFGLAKFLGRDFSRVVTTFRGTIGYLAPEWISGTAITSKVDVYSYGMVLLEIVSGKSNSPMDSSSDEDPGNYYPVQVARMLLNGDILSLVDANLHDDVNIEEVERVCKVACWCIQDSKFDRPTMAEVVQFLEGICEPEMPPVPRLLHAIAGGSHSTGL